MKVGILTIHHSRNYGAVWQAWATSKTVTSLGHSVEIIDYRPRSAVNFYRRSYVKRPHLMLQGHRFHRFIKGHLSLSPSTIHHRSGLADAVDRYDAVVVGSDQIWMHNQVRGFSPEYFLHFVEGNAPRRVSYAPSFGQNTAVEEGEKRDTIAKALAGFAHLSGRDENTCGLVRQYSGRDAALVLDPTMLVDKTQWPVQASRHEPPYLLAFGAFSEQQIRSVRQIARSAGLKVMACGKAFPKADLDHSLAHPLTWLSKIASAQMVVTDFFHGVVFSLIFERPFLVLGKESKAIKVKDLLQRLGLSDRWLTPERLTELAGSDTALDRLVQDVLSFDHAPVSEAVQRYRESSINYLRDALSP